MWGWGGISDGEFFCAILFVALIGGGVCIGLEHVACWLCAHVAVVLK